MALSATTALLGLLALVALVTVVLAFRHRLGFRIAVRNVRRGRTRTVLLVAGLLIGTTIVSGSLVVGDTVQQLVLHYTYLGAGYVDEEISGPSSSGAFVFYPYGVYSNISKAVSGSSSIAGIAPEIVATASALDRRTGVPETNLNLIGVNGNQSGALGSFVSTSGASIAGPAAGQVLIDQQTADALNATVGDTLAVFGTNSALLTVQAIVQENVRGAFITGGLSPGNLFVTLPTGQALENASGEINYIAITNTGSQTAGASSSSAVAAYLNQTIGADLTPYHLTVHTPLESSITSANQSSQGLLTLFLVLGLFSIVAGALLIVGIFVMLAEERKGEMGMLRAIGLRRRELVYSYLFEGVIYAAGSALAGVVVGVGVGYLLDYLAGFILAGEGIPQGAILQSFTVTHESLVIAYVVGFLLTLVTVVVACRRASHLNIVRAIRDIPEPPPPVRTYTFLAYLGAAFLAVGLWVYLETYRGATDISYPKTAGILVVVGAGLLAARFLRNRPVFSAVGVAMMVWGGFAPLDDFLLGSSHTGGIFIVFVDGIAMVGGAIVLYVFNAPTVAAGVSRILGRRSNSSPVVRVALAYSTRQPTRTAVSLTIFALVVFTMVATAGFGTTVQASLNRTISDQSGGYTFFGFSQVPIPNLWNLIEANGTLHPLFADGVPIVTGAVDVAVAGYVNKSFQDGLYSAPTNTSGVESFYGTNQFAFRSTLGGRSAAATFSELATNASVAVVDGRYAPATISFGTGSGPHPTVTVGQTIGLSTPGSSTVRNVTVIGVLQETILNGVWVSPALATEMGYAGENGFFLTTAAGVSADHAAQQAKIAFFSSGLVLFNIGALLATSIATTEGFIGLLEIFVGLGLGVGIAAMGILALRAVVERRREIGMLRASGFTKGMVLRTLFLEYSFTTLLGVGIGIALGLLIVRNLVGSPSAAAAGITTFAAPWALVIEVAVIAYGLVLVAIAGPAWRASQLPPAEAVRATE
ncbi:MAG TPA: FtsX-like permease family protein [Thermoplasmata archaeon]|nr:FtsX-like permease family protein [Thermoplasmata archaeon]